MGLTYKDHGIYCYPVWSKYLSPSISAKTTASLLPRSQLRKKSRISAHTPRANTAETSGHTALRYHAKRSGRHAVIVAQEFTESLVTLGDSTSHSVGSQPGSAISRSLRTRAAVGVRRFGTM